MTSKTRQTSSDSTTSKSPPETRPPFPWKKWLSITVAALFVLILFAPTVICKTPLLSGLINRYAPINGTVEFQSASLGWFSETQLSGLIIKDADKKVVLSAQKVSLDKSLTGLIFGGVDDTTIEIVDPFVEIHVNDGIVNLQKLAVDQGNDSSTEIPKLHCIVRNGKFSFFRNNESCGEIFEFDSDVVCEPLKSNDGGTRVKTTIATKVLSSKQSTGSFDSEIEFEIQSEKISKANGTLTTQHISIDFVNAFSEISKSPQFSACLTGDVEVKTSLENYALKTLSANFDNLRIDSEATDGKTLISNVPSFPLSISGDVNLDNGQTGVQLTVDSAYGSAKTTGTVPANGVSSTSDLFDQTFQINADFDVAKFASDFPELIQLQEGVVLESGKISLTSFGRTEGNTKRIFLDVRAGELRATRSGEVIEWTDPISLAVALRRNQIDNLRTDIELEYIKCESEFLTLNGSGKLEEGKGNIRGNLGVLKAKLAQFIELGEFDLDGRIDGSVDWGVANRVGNTGEGQVIQLSGKIDLDNLSYATSGLPRLNEPNSSIQFASKYRLADYVPNELSQLSIMTSVGTDFLKVELREPTPFREDYRFVFDSEVKGNAEAWMKRVSSFADLYGLKVEGMANASAVVFLTPQTIRVRTTKTPSIKPFNLQVADVVLQEPIVRGKVDFTYDFVTGLIDAPLVSISSSAVNAESKNFKSTQLANDILYSGDFAMTGNLKRIGLWLPKSSTKIDGDLSGLTKIQMDSNLNRITVDGSISNLVVTQKRGQPGVSNGQINSANVLFEDQKVKFDLKMNASADGNRIAVNKLSVVGTGTQLETNGNITFEESKTILDLTGKIRADLVKISDRLKPIFGDNIQFTGTDESTFALSGPVSGPSLSQTSETNTPLVPNGLEGTAKLNWNEGKIFALPISKGTLDTTLKNSVVYVRPIDMLVGNGQLQLAPTIFLDSRPYRIQVPKGVVLNHAAIGPEVCRTWMRYIAPLLADATTAEGKFTLSLNQDLVMPLENPMAGTFAGQMGIDAITVGPGPLGQSLISMLRQTLALIGKEDKLRTLSDKPWLQLPRQAINVSLENGIIKHDQLIMNIGEVQIVTTGSVSLDQSIDIQVIIPIKPDWLNDSPIIKTVLGNAIRIPLRGKLHRPEMNSSFFTQLSKDIAKAAAGNLLENGAKGILSGDLLKGDAKELLEGKTGDLIKGGILNGLRSLRNKK